MIKLIVATEAVGLETTNLVMALDVFDENINIEQAVMAACKEYCRKSNWKKAMFSTMNLISMEWQSGGKNTIKRS